MTEAEVLADKNHANEFRVEQFHDDGAAEVAIFVGPNSRDRARRFASALNYGEITSKSTSSIQV